MRLSDTNYQSKADNAASGTIYGPVKRTVV